MTSLAPVSRNGQLQQPLGRRGPWFAAIWLFFLLDPLLVGWHHRGTVAGVAGMVLTIVFGTVYMAMWLRLWRRGAPPAAKLSGEFHGPPATSTVACT